MPYVITTKRPGKYGPEHYAAEADIRSRRAVATLEQARHDVELVMVERKGDGPMPDRRTILAARGLPESGGTVGPLPDGTVIEVERVGWSDLAADVSDTVLARLWGEHAAAVPSAEIIDAYNARS